MTKAVTKAATKKSTPTEGTETADLGKLNRTDLADQVAQLAGLSKVQSRHVVDAALGAVVGALQQGQSVTLPGLGTLSVKATAARAGVRPGTSERIQIPAGKKVAFKVAGALKESLGGSA